MAITDVLDRVQQLRIQIGLAQPGTAGTAATFAGALNAARTGGLDANGTGAAAANAAGRSQGLGSGAGGFAGLPGTAGVTGEAVVADARRYLGIPYVFGSTDPKKGLDCSSLVQRVYSDLGVKLPRIAKDQAKIGQPVANLAQAKPGDLVCFNNPVDHIGIYIGDNKMIVAPRTGDVVKVQTVYKTPSTIRRVLPDNAAALPALRPSALAGAGATTGATPVSGSAPGGGAVPYADMFTRAANKHGVSPALLAAVAKVESGYNPRAVSPAGARGLMQIMPGTAKGLGVDPLDPAQAIDGAARLLKSNLREFGSLPLALAAYNAGGGAVRKHGGIPPYKETQAYVPKVQAAMAALVGKGWQ